MKTQLKKIAIIIIALILNSCSKDDSPEPQFAITKTYLAKTTFANIGSYSYNYDNQSKLVSVVFVSANESANPSFTYIVKSFEGDKIKTALIDYDLATKQDFDIVNSYNSVGKKISELYYIATTQTLSSGNTIEYISNIQIKINSVNSANSVTGYDIYNYDTSGKNVIETKRYNATNVLIYTQSYSGFDSKMSYQSLNPQGYSTGVKSANNNASTVYAPVTGAVSTFNYTYEYNNDGYVTKRTSASGAINTYEYITK